MAEPQPTYQFRDSFKWKAPRLDAYGPITDKKLEVLLIKYPVRSAENMSGNVKPRILLNAHRQAFASTLVFGAVGLRNL